MNEELRGVLMGVGIAAFIYFVAYILYLIT
jgi:hypothetical protein